MDTLPESDWRGLPVETASGAAVGRLSSIELDPLSHRVAFYHVRRRRLVPGGPDLLVAPKQVVEFTDERMVVEDLVEAEGAARRSPTPASTPSPVMPAAR